MQAFLCSIFRRLTRTPPDRTIRFDQGVFNLHAVNAAGTSSCGEHGRLESGVLPGKGSGEWQTLETGIDHVRLPGQHRGVCACLLAQWKTNPIVKDMANRRLLATTFIFSQVSAAKPGRWSSTDIWSVIDMGEEQ